MSTPGRYVNEPLIKLLDLYVLWSIGEISESDEQMLIEFTPNLRRSLCITPAGEQMDTKDMTWLQLITVSMGFSEDLPAVLRKMWLENLEIARQNNAILTPQQFAEMVVDRNFRDDDDR